MAKKTRNTKSAKVRGSNEVVNALRQVVADSYAVMGQTHLCHWNVEGPGFFALHTAFEAQYTELFQAVDKLAERIRALGAYAPGGLGNLARMAGIDEIKEDASAKDMVVHLAAIHRKLVADAVIARDLAAEAGDKESEDLMIGRIEAHQKTIWMLDSYLK